MFLVIIFITFLLSTFAFSQIFGSLIFKIFKGKFMPFIITIIIWGIILLVYYLIIVKWFNKYFDYYLYTTIVSAIISFFTIREN